MTERIILRQRIEAALDLMNSGRLDDAQTLLDSVMKDPEIHVLSRSRTVLGLPRKLHAAYLTLAKRRGDIVQRTGYQFTLVPEPAALAPHGVYSHDEKQALARAGREPVPPILHQIWIGALDVPPAVKAWRSHADVHGYEYRLWRESELQRLGVIDNPVFKAMLERGDYPGAVDVARYLILDSHGGIYLDCDWYPARDDISFHHLLPLVGLTALAEDTPRLTGTGSLLLTNSLIAAPPSHPAFRRMLHAMPQAWEQLPDAPAWWSTGPLLFTVICRGSAVTIPHSGIVAANLPRRAPLADIEAIRARAIGDDLGLIIGWKSW